MITKQGKPFMTLSQLILLHRSTTSQASRFLKCRTPLARKKPLEIWENNYQGSLTQRDVLISWNTNGTKSSKLFYSQVGQKLVGVLTQKDLGNVFHLLNHGCKRWNQNGGVCMEMHATLEDRSQCCSHYQLSTTRQCFMTAVSKAPKKTTGRYIFSMAQIPDWIWT